MKKIANDDDRLKEQKKVEVVVLERLPAGAGERIWSSCCLLGLGEDQKKKGKIERNKIKIFTY